MEKYPYTFTITSSYLGLNLPYLIEPFKVSVISKKNVGFQNILIVGVNSCTNTTFCKSICNFPKCKNIAQMQDTSRKCSQRLTSLKNFSNSVDTKIHAVLSSIFKWSGYNWQLLLPFIEGRQFLGLHTCFPVHKVTQGKW